MPIPTTMRGRSEPMKVVLFCGGRGIRLREHSEAIPKPMVPIGYRPILWHVMRYYAHFGHRDFILCLGYRGDAIKDYFLHYDEAVSNDFVLSDGGRQVELLSIRHRTTGGSPSPTPGSTPPSASGCAAVRHHLEGEEMFLANYGDTLTDAPLDRIVDGVPRERRGGDARSRPPGLLVPRRRRDDDRRARGHRRDTDEAGHPDQRRLLHASGREIFDYLGVRRGPGRRAVRAARRRGPAAARSATTASGSRSTRSRTSPAARKGSRRRDAAPWALWRIGTAAGPPAPRDQLTGQPRSGDRVRAALGSSSRGSGRCAGTAVPRHRPRRQADRPERRVQLGPRRAARPTSVRKPTVRAEEVAVRPGSCACRATRRRPARPRSPGTTSATIWARSRIR